MGLGRLMRSWPVYRQVTGTDPLGKGKAAKVEAVSRLVPAPKP
jgi:formate dehydrogenase major subunit